MMMVASIVTYLCEINYAVQPVLGGGWGWKSLGSWSSSVLSSATTFTSQVGQYLCNSSMSSIVISGVFP